MGSHLENIPKSLKDQKSSEAEFRQTTFWKPVQDEVLIRLMPLWMERLSACKDNNDLGGGEMDEKIEELGYKLLLVGPQVDFYLRLLAKIILGKMKPSYLCGQIKVTGVTCMPNIWWYLLILAQCYGAETEFAVPNVGDTIIIRVMSTFKSLFSPQRVGKVIFEKKHFRRSKVMEDGEVRKTSKFIGKSKVLCDPDHPVKIIYKNGNIRLMFFCKSSTILMCPLMPV